MFIHVQSIVQSYHIRNARLLPLEVGCRILRSGAVMPASTQAT